MDNYIEKLVEKIKSEGRTFRWFRDKYLPQMHYQTMMNQKNDYTSKTKEFKEAIKKYLAE